MSIVFSGTRTRSRGVISSIIKELKSINLKPLKKVSVHFDPFHDKVSETRSFMFHMSAPKILATNLSCVFKTEILNNRSDPTITCDFENDEKLVFKSANLTVLEILQLFNKHVSSRVPPAEEVIAPVKKPTKKR